MAKSADIIKTGTVDFFISLKGAETKPVRVALKNKTKHGRQAMMAWKDTWGGESKFKKYNPADKASVPLVYSLNGNGSDRIKNITSLKNLDLQNAAFKPELISYYGFRFSLNGEHIWGFKSAAQSKSLKRSGILATIFSKSGEQIETFEGDTLQVKNDFDFVVIKGNIYITGLHAFQNIANFSSEILKHSNANLAKVHKRTNVIDLQPITKYASKTVRAAKLLSGLVSDPNLEKLSFSKLKKLADDDNIGYTITTRNNENSLAPQKKSELAFLKMISKRIFSVDIYDGVDKQTFEALWMTPFNPNE